MHNANSLLILMAMPDFSGWALSASKVAQILLPLGFFILFREMPWQGTMIRALVNRLYPAATEDAKADYRDLYERRFGRLLGFLTWKVGCDLGFLLIIGTEWERSFTLAGLIPYVIGQYVVYRLFGQKMLLSGLGNPLAAEEYRVPPLQRKKPLRRTLSKFLHEDLNATSPHVPMRRVFLKPMADYLAVLVCWSLYTMGLFFAQSLEINWQPLVRFPHAFMIGMYAGGVIAFILGHNLGEFLVRHWNLHLLPGRHARSPYWLRSLRWRMRPWDVKYGITISRVIPLFCGAVMVAFVAPAVLKIVEGSASDFRIGLFIRQGILSEQQLLQIAPPDPASGELPDFKRQEALYESLRDSRP
jgi:hypothetical protein